MVRIPRSQNSHVDSLATLASSLDEFIDFIPQMIPIELLDQPSIKHHAIAASTTMLEPSWMDPYISFLFDGSLPIDSKESKKVWRKLARF